MSVTDVGPMLAVDVPEPRALEAVKFLSEVDASWRLRQERVSLRIGLAL